MRACASVSTLVGYSTPTYPQATAVLGARCRTWGVIITRPNHPHTPTPTRPPGHEQPREPGARPSVPAPRPRGSVLKRDAPTGVAHLHRRRPAAEVSAAGSSSCCLWMVLWWMLLSTPFTSCSWGQQHCVLRLTLSAVVPALGTSDPLLQTPHPGCRPPRSRPSKPQSRSTTRTRTVLAVCWGSTGCRACWGPSRVA